MVEHAALLHRNATRQTYTFSRLIATDTVSDYMIVFGTGYDEYRDKVEIVKQYFEGVGRN